MLNCKVGDFVEFGKYLVDNSEKIRWLVLEVKGGKALLLSENAVDCRKYHNTKEAVSWNTCDLRDWLNNEFLVNAFNDQEISVIQTANVAADRNPEHRSDPGQATQDKVFLLSIAEVNRYFSDNESRQCEPSEIAAANGAYISEEGKCWWWLRTAGYRQDTAGFVRGGGSVSESGDDVEDVIFAVRPAIWVNTN